MSSPFQSSPDANADKNNSGGTGNQQQGSSPFQNPGSQGQGYPQNAPQGYGQQGYSNQGRATTRAHPRDTGSHNRATTKPRSKEGRSTLASKIGSQK